MHRPALVLPHGPDASASQSTFVACLTRHAPRSWPAVSIAKRSGSLPESLMVNNTSGSAELVARAELSLSAARAWSGIVAMSVGRDPIESAATALSTDSPRFASAQADRTQTAALSP